MELLDWDENKSELLKKTRGLNVRGRYMKQKISPEILEQKIAAGEEVVDEYFDVENAILGRPRKFLPRRDIIKTNLDLTKELAEELDEMAGSLNISRQAVIKMMVRFSLDQHYKSNQIKKQQVG